MGDILLALIVTSLFLIAYILRQIFLIFQAYWDYERIKRLASLKGNQTCHGLHDELYQVLQRPRKLSCMSKELL